MARHPVWVGAGMTLDTPLDFALAYAQAGYPVIPVRGKIPLTEHGAHDGTIDPARLSEWWDRWPDANIGMTLADLVVVDVDPRNGGDVDALPHPLPDTCYAKTGGGGFHYLYHARNGTKYPGSLGAGIDLKHGAGAYIVVEPSIHASGEKYVWLDESEPWGTKPAEAPEWLAANPDTPKAETREHGGKPVELLDNVADGNALHDSLRDLAAHYAALGVGFGEICKLLEMAMQASKAPRDDRWRNRMADIPKLANSAIEKFRAKQAAPAIVEWPAAIDLAALAEREPEAPKFIIPDWLPCGYATLLAGHGGVGKSAIALYLACCIASGRSFFGLAVERRAVVYLACEDREGVLHWRLDRICRHLGIGLFSLRRSLQIIDLVGRDSLLWERDPRTGYTMTAAYAELQARIHEYETEVLIVDGISDTFAGNENSRGDVTRFKNALVALIPADTGAVLLVGHVNKPSSTAGAAGDGYSGSTQWHNGVRGRWYLYPEASQGEDGERTERTGDLILELQKSNLGQMDQSMRFTWNDEAKLFLGREVIGATASDRGHRDSIERRGILAALKACADAGLYVPAAMTGPRTAYLVLSQRPEFPDSLRGGGRAKTRRFWRSIEALRHMRHVEDGSIERKNRKHTVTLVLTPEGCAACA